MRRLLPYLKIAVTLAAAYFIVRLVIDHASSMADLALRLKPLPLLAGIALTFVSTLSIVFLWTWIVHPANAFHRLLNLTFLKANLIRYIPGNVFGLGARVLFAEQHGVPKKVGGMSLVAESVLLLATTGTLAFAYLRPWALPLAAVGVVSVLMIVSRNFRHRPGVPDPRRIVLLYLLYLTYGLTLGLALRFFADSAGVQLGTAEAIGVFSLAWFLGFVSLLTPSGLVVREGTIIFFLSPAIGTPAATFLALMSRLAIVLTDVVTAGVYVLVARR